MSDAPKEMELGSEEWMDLLSHITGNDAYNDEFADVDNKIAMIIQQALKNMGFDPTKFRANIEGFIKVQQDYTKSFANVRSNLQARLQAGQKNAGSADEVRKALIEELTAGLEGDAKKNIAAILGNLKLEQGDIDKFISTGDFSAFGDQITEAGKKQVEEIMKIAQERQKAEQVLIDLTKKRIEAERNYIDAIKQGIDLQLEGRELQGKYGGKQVTSEDRKIAILEKSNAESQMLGLPQLRGGKDTIADLASRREAIRQDFAKIEENKC
jgi:hypothetical protein